MYRGRIKEEQNINIVHKNLQKKTLPECLFFVDFSFMRILSNKVEK